MVSTVLSLVILPVLVAAQGGSINSTGDAIVSIDFPETIVAGDYLTFSYVFDGQTNHELRNITAELMVGKAEDNGQEVADIMLDHGNPLLSDNGFGYQAHAATPEGNYHVRVNGSVFFVSSDFSTGETNTTFLSNTTLRSKTFILSSGKPFACTTPTWTPVASVADPNYYPLRLATPNGGDMFWLSNLSAVGKIMVTPYFTDQSFITGMAGAVPIMTMELVQSGTGKVAGGVTLNSTMETYQYLPTDQFPNLSVGAWKASRSCISSSAQFTDTRRQVRANFTSASHIGQNFSALSDEFYVAASGPCVGLQSGNSTTDGPAGGGATDGGKNGVGAAPRLPASAAWLPGLG
ncbi:hypothetical protein GGX14DRAFT_400709 [Mycena pura]|uniref:Uncharacterized protein n=1 Tax=Mycena pura TaxID=153505 RepID=A0AAD6V478_9AGAR|nr:hypothetical protein GGX14DRAFT_400709 [Mycena pura]